VKRLQKFLYFLCSPAPVEIDFFAKGWLLWRRHVTAKASFTLQACQLSVKQSIQGKNRKNRKPSHAAKFDFHHSGVAQHAVPV
jgi:hypothetical protein